MNGIVLDPIIPPAFIWVLALLLLGATGYVYLFVGSRLSRTQNSVLLFFRLVAIVLILVLLLQPSRREESPERRAEKILLVGVIATRVSSPRRRASRHTRQPSTGSIESGISSGSPTSEEGEVDFAFTSSDLYGNRTNAAPYRSEGKSAPLAVK